VTADNEDDAERTGMAELLQRYIPLDHRFEVTSVEEPELTQEQKDFVDELVADLGHEAAIERLKGLATYIEYWRTVHAKTQ
jgi:hypothetical protein